MVAFTGGVTAGKLPPPVASPEVLGCVITLKLVWLVVAPTRMRHITTVPLTGETRPPVARSADGSDVVATVQDGPHELATVGALPRSLPIVTVA